jgi:hypothetical protein
MYNADIIMIFFMVEIDAFQKSIVLVFSRESNSLSLLSRKPAAIGIGFEAVNLNREVPWKGVSLRYC